MHNILKVSPSTHFKNSHFLQYVFESFIYLNAGITGSTPSGSGEMGKCLLQFFTSGFIFNHVQIPTQITMIKKRESQEIFGEQMQAPFW